MHGLIFVTWERYLAERFGSAFLGSYRVHIGETAEHGPLASRVYSDAELLKGVSVAHQLTRVPAETLLRESGYYFIMNGLTGHLCAYLLTRVHSGRELLLTMHDAHSQMRRTADNITPPLFTYEALSENPNEFALIYDSPRRLCALLYGAIEGAAARYGQQVKIFERTCMHRGDSVCRFELRFSASSKVPILQETAEIINKRKMQQQLTSLVLSILPGQNGITLHEVQSLLQRQTMAPLPFRLSALLEAVLHLQYAGLAASTANQDGDNLSIRRYWRAPTTDTE